MKVRFSFLRASALLLGLGAATLTSCEDVAENPAPNPNPKT